MDSYGRITPFNFFYVIGYTVEAHDGKRIENSSDIGLDIHVYSSRRGKEKDPSDKIRVEIYTSEMKFE